MISWKQNFFVIFCAVLCLSHCGDVGVAPVFKTKVDAVQVMNSLVLDPSAFTLVGVTSKKEIQVKVDLEKVKGASTLVFSTRDSCLNGESRDIEENLIFTVPENVYNTTFSLYIQLKKETLASSRCVKVKKVTHDTIAPLLPSIQINSEAV